jgi:hypothetical protein
MRSFAQGVSATNPRRIDHHFSPPQWLAFVRGRELLQPANAACAS